MISILPLLLFVSCTMISSPINSTQTVEQPITVAPAVVSVSDINTQPTVSPICHEEIQKLATDKNRFCALLKHKEGCYTVKKKEIIHYEKQSTNPSAKKVLVISSIHGDESVETLKIAFRWLERLEEIDPRNSWRILPLVNVDGHLLNTRMNANGVDLNRNFPTKNWDEEAKNFWKRMHYAKNKFPGNSAASEPETQCIVSHIEEYVPDLIISIHTPLSVLDFDGPKVSFPPYAGLRWRRLGHFPGSLGRYMWRDHATPVLTIELKGEKPNMSFEEMDQLQDVIGLLSLWIDKTKKQSTK